MNIDMKRVFKHFEGMDAYREQTLKEVRAVANQPNVYSQAYISEYRKEKLEALKADRLARAQKAKEEIELIKGELTTKQYKSPYDDIKEQVITPEHKMLAEMQHARKLDLLKTELQLAESPADFKKLIEQYGEYEDFNKHINLEIKNRARDKENGSKFEALRLELNKQPDELHELSRLESTLTTIGNMDMHPIGFENGDLNNVKYERVLG